MARDTNAITPSESSQPKTYDELLPKLSPAMRKMCLSRKTQEEKSKKDEWFSSLQYLNASINDLPISESFLDNGSEFDGFNLATVEALGWKVDKPSKFAVKGNSEHISEALGWYTNVAVTLKDMKGNPIITTIARFKHNVRRNDQKGSRLDPSESAAPPARTAIFIAWVLFSS